MPVGQSRLHGKPNGASGRGLPVGITRALAAAMPKSRLVTGACLLCGSFVTSVAAADPPTDSPRFELAPDPVGLFMGNYVLAAAYALTDHVVARASYSHGDPSMQLTTFHATATAQVFLQRAFHGPF